MNNQDEKLPVGSSKNLPATVDQELAQNYEEWQEGSWQAYCQLGNSLQEKREFEKAVIAYRRAIELNPDSFWSYYNLAKILLYQEKWEEAAIAYGRALKINPDYSWSYYSLGVALAKLEKSEQAVAAYRRAIELNPDFFGSYHNLGDALTKLEKWQEAAQAYSRAIELNSELSWSYNNLGMALFKQEKWEEAIASYRRAIELSPDLAGYYKNLGDALFKLEKISEALVAYGRAIELDPEHIWVIKNLGEVIEKKGNISESIIVYRNAIKLVQDDYLLYAILGRLLMQDQQWEEAISSFIKLLQIKPDSLGAYDNIASILEKQGYIIEAGICYTNRTLPLILLQKFCQLTGEWEVNSESEASINHISIYPENPINLFPSNTLDSNRVVVNQKFDSKTIFIGVAPDGQIKWNIQNSTVSPKAFVAVVPEGRAWGDIVTSAVITSDNKLVGNISTRGNAELVLTSDKLPAVEYIDGTVAFLSVKWGGAAYFHWMFDVIVRIDLLQRCGLGIENIDQFVVNSYSRPYEIETLQALGIPSSKIIEISQHPHIQAKKLVVPSLPYQGGYKASAWAYEFLKSNFLNQTTPQKNERSQRIYISRKPPSVRQIQNEEAVLKLLDNFGFTQVILESMSVAEQAACLAAAEVVVAPHGGGLTNLVFCSPGTKVIEIFSPWYVPGEYWIVSNGCGLKHYSLIGELFDEDSSTHPGSRNILVNLEHLEQLLKIAGVAHE